MTSCVTCTLCLRSQGDYAEEVETVRNVLLKIRLVTDNMYLSHFL
jgi:hypothetical protein